MSRFQLFAVILQTQIGIGVITFPYELHLAAGADGWMSILLTGGAVQLLLVCFALLAGRFPNRNLFEFAPLLLGRWLGNTLTAFYVLHFTLTACVILLLEMRFVDLWLLPFNSPWPVILANFAVLAFFVRQKIAVIARYYTLILFLIVVLVILMLIGSNHGDYRFLLPVGQSGWLPVTGGMKSALMSFLGFEFFLVVCGDANARGAASPLRSSGRISPFRSFT